MPNPVRFLIDDLIPKGGAGLFVGDSGLGKTPFLVQLGLCVACGLPFLGYNTRQGRVLFVDAESLEEQFNFYLHTLGRFLHLPTDTEDFMIHSPNWHREAREAHTTLGMGKWIEHLIEKYQPSFVILDCLRPLFPEAESEASKATALWVWQRRLAQQYDLTLLTVHHKRKLAKDKGRIVKVSLAENPFEWFEEASGHKALVNQADFRIGYECPDIANERDQLLIAGFGKSTGEIEPIYFDRLIDEVSEAPKGYRNASERLYEALSEERKALWAQLPPTFRFKHVRSLLKAKSNGPVGKCISALREAGLCKKRKEQGVAAGYRKLWPEYAK